VRSEAADPRDLSRTESDDASSSWCARTRAWSRIDDRDATLTRRTRLTPAGWLLCRDVAHLDAIPHEGVDLVVHPSAVRSASFGVTGLYQDSNIPEDARLLDEYTHLHRDQSVEAARGFRHTRVGGWVVDCKPLCRLEFAPHSRSTPL
jgi:hypothetical protein